MKRSLFSLALAGLAVAAAMPASALNTSGTPEFERGYFRMAEAYPCTSSTYAATLGIAAPQLFSGVCPPGTPASGAVPGVLSLARRGNFAVDVNCFAVTPPGEFGCVVQSVRFVKLVPGSFKCPDVFGQPHFDSSGNLVPYRYVQFGNGIRTWWSLNFTQPGSQFLLQVTSVCQFTQNIDGRTVQGVHIHKDNWRWVVVADVETLANVINLFHTGAVSTLEIPCILAEDMFDALVNATNRLRGALASGSKADIGNAIFDFEALIIANCLFIEVLNPVVVFPGPKQFTDPAGVQPPSNLAQTVFFPDGGTAVAGIIDTIEHPCCCKLLVDLEYIAIRSGLTGQTPTLPVF